LNISNHNLKEITPLLSDGKQSSDFAPVTPTDLDLDAIRSLALAADIGATARWPLPRQSMPAPRTNSRYSVLSGVR
jgi:hypothetical protein